MTRKISRSVAKIHLGQLESFSLGNLDSKRDWGHAKDYVEVNETNKDKSLSHTATQTAPRSASKPNSVHIHTKR